MAVLCIAASASTSLAQSDAPPSAHPGDGVPDPAGRIAFGRITRMDGFFGQVVALYAIDPDGSDLVQLTEGDSALPAWSPDGRLAFTQRQPDGSWQIATIDRGGGDLRLLTSGLGVAQDPSWSPDGTWIAYDYAPSLIADDNYHPSLYRMNADGSEPTLLGDPDAFDVEPQISPDGTRLLFARYTFDDVGQHGWLMVRDLTTGEEVVIDAAGDSVEHPRWSPDGQWIIHNVASWMTGAVPQDQIERIAADGSGEPDVLVAGTATQRGFKPSYSPDGERIVFGCQGTAGDDAMCLADADGTNIVTLVDQPGVHENHFSWGVAAE
jgi:TolB protein